MASVLRNGDLNQAEVLQRLCFKHLEDLEFIGHSLGNVVLDVYLASEKFSSRFSFSIVFALG